MKTSVRDDATSTSSRGDAETMRNISPHRFLRTRWTSTRDAVHRWALVWLVHVFFSARAWARNVVDRAFRACGLAWCEPRRGLRHAWRRGTSAIVERVARRRGKSLVYDAGAAPGRAPKRVGLCVVMDDDFEDAGDDDTEARETTKTTMEKVCEVCEWCATRGVASVMVYDREGVCASAAGVKALERGLRQRGKGRGSALDGLDFVLSVVDSCDGGKIKEVARSSRGGSGQIEVCAVGGREACAALVDAARRVEFDDEDDDEEVDSNAPTADDTTMGTFTYKRDVTRLERWMRKQGTFLPPSDAVVVFGSTFHLDGYPPWQAHAAQLYHEESLARFTSSDFERIIDRYRSTAQRFGR